MFMNLLYGEMAGAWLWHFVIPLLASLFIWKFMKENSHINRILALIGVSMAASFVCHFILLLVVQSVSCSAVKNVGSIALGSAIGSLIVGGMICIPAFIQPMHLVVSQLYSHHYPLLTPELAALQQQAVQLASSVTFTEKSVQQPTAPVESEEKSAVTKAIDTKEEEKEEEKSRALQVGGALPAQTTIKSAALLQKDYDYQTFKEIAIGAGFWAAFGGVYGVGIGSLYAAKCS
jgi:hypothetical protein